MGIARLFFVNRSLLASVMIVFSVTLIVSAAEKPELTETNAAKPLADNSADAQQTFRAYIQLQEQIHQTMLALEEMRKEAQATGKQNADLIAARLNGIEQAVSLQRAREENARYWNRLTVILAAGLGAVALLVMLVAAWFLVKTARQFSAVAGMGGAAGLGHASPVGLLGDSAGLLHAQIADESGVKLLGAIDRLEKRIYQIEHGAPGPQKNANSSGHHAEGNGSEIALMLGKGQSLLHLDQADEALRCFNEVLAMEPDNTEALLKKGTALERLRRLEDAVECYDRAIAVDDSMTLAYLYKGGVFNQLERFGEALECYERALLTQHKVAVS
jgi:tetratricopeptide (TPR) repeat protein